jgi:hypothetical protein
MKDQIVEDIKEYHKVVSKLEEGADNGLWYRGQTNAEWDLTPRLYRYKQWSPSRKVKPARLRLADDESRERFAIEGMGLSDVRFLDKWDLYFVMQHFGTDTRLLDWTDSALIGLYFAVRQNRGYYDAAVWTIDPWKLNRMVVKVEEVVPPGDPGISKEDKTRYEKWLWDRFEKRKRWPTRPAAVYPGHIMRRIGAQKSCFTIHGSDRRGLDRIAGQLKINLTKIVIPSWCVGSIKESLAISGIDETTVFPDLEGLSRRLNEENANEEGKPHEKVYARLRPSKLVKGEIGVFAIRKIRKGTPIFRGDLDEMVWLEEGNLPKGPQQVRRLYDDFAVIRPDRRHKKKKRYGCPLNFNRLTISWYLNNSQNPNVRCDKHYNFFAKKDIDVGDELTVDYSTYSEDE